MEEEGKISKHNFNNVTTDTLFQSPVTIKTKNKDANMTYETQITLGILSPKGLKSDTTFSKYL